MDRKERKIMVAVDDSEESMFALSWCITKLISHTPNVKLVLLYVKPPLPIHSFNAAWHIFSRDVASAMEKRSKDLANSVMERAEAICKKLNTTNVHLLIDGIEMERIVGCGKVKDVICSVVQKLEVDTLVLGTHGYGFFKRAFHGSVSDYCARHAKCAVVIVKHP